MVFIRFSGHYFKRSLIIFTISKSKPFLCQNIFFFVPSLFYGSKCAPARRLSSLVATFLRCSSHVHRPKSHFGLRLTILASIVRRNRTRWNESFGGSLVGFGNVVGKLGIFDICKIAIRGRHFACSRTCLELTPNLSGLQNHNRKCEINYCGFFFFFDFLSYSRRR